MLLLILSACLGRLEDNARPSQGAVTKLASPLPLQQAVIVLPGWQLWVGGTALNTIRGPWDMCHTWPPPPPPWVLWSDVTGVLQEEEIWTRTGERHVRRKAEMR